MANKTPTFFFFKSGQIYMKDADSAESKEKSKIQIFRYGRICSFSYWNFPNFRWILTITRKIEIGKIGKLPSFIKVGSKLRMGARGGLHILSWDGAQTDIQPPLSIIGAPLCTLLTPFKRHHEGLILSTLLTPFQQHYGVEGFKGSHAPFTRAITKVLGRSIEIAYLLVYSCLTALTYPKPL